MKDLLIRNVWLATYLILCGVIALLYLRLI